MAPPRAVIFDIGRVLVGWNPEGVYDALIGEGRRRALFAEVPMEAVNLAVDGGAPFAAAWEDLARAHPAWSAEIRLWPAHWDRMIGPPIEGSVAILRALRARGVPVWALTNFGDETFERARTLFPFFDEFDRAFVSARMRMLKPEDRIYAAVEEATGLSGPDLFFTDDREDNIAAARARGWRGHVFTSPEGLAKALAAEGLPLSAETTA
jgi:2-haloacid dehalogenase